MAVIEKLSEEECYLAAILMDESGLDQAEFLWHAADHEGGCFRAWPFQRSWWRNSDPLQIDQCARSVGKSLSIQVKACAFSILHPAQEMVVTAPEGIHLQAVTDLVETRLLNTRFYKEMLVPNANNGITHRPFLVKFRNGARIMGRIPQRDGRGVKGCVGEGTMILTETGYRPVETLRVGDLVATHKGNWKPVQYIYEDTNDCFEVKGQGSHPLTVSCDHSFYGASNIAGPKQKKDFSEGVYFEDVILLEETDFHWATPYEIPELPIPGLDFNGTASTFGQDTEAFWYLTGRYLADGHLTSNKNGKERRIHWCVHPNDQPEVISRLDSLGLSYRIEKRDHSTGDYVIVNSAAWNRWLEEHFGKLADGKKIPAFALGMDKFRDELLEGYLAGDGHFNAARKRWECGTASEVLALGLQLLGQTVGYTANVSKVQPRVTEIMGVPLKNRPKTSWRVQFCVLGTGVAQEGVILNRISSVESVGKKRIYNPIIQDDHSYISGSIVSHNVHPLHLELDEAQDYPSAGWTEIIETLKRGHAGARWRAHGVTRGMRDEFFKFTQPGSDWTVHRFTAMARPTWTDEERQEKIEAYGSQNHPDYRRNVLGLHGDVQNPLFVLHRLMACVDLDPDSDYNDKEFVRLDVNAEMIDDVGGDIFHCVDLPQSHTQYKTTWAGMDVGFTNHPSEILVFAEVPGPRKDSPTILKLVARLHLERVSNPDQAKLILYLIGFYKLNAFSMDKTGNGLGLYQDIMKAAEDDHDIRDHRDTIKGYNFSEKILVDFDQSIDVDEFGGDVVEDAGIKQQVLEYSSDKLREYVDLKRIALPDDRDLIAEFQGQTWTYDKSGMDRFGRKSYSKGKFHALDAARMAVLGHAQYGIEAFMREHSKIETVEPVFDMFIQV